MRLLSSVSGGRMTAKAHRLPQDSSPTVAGVYRPEYQVSRDNISDRFIRLALLKSSGSEIF